MLGKPFKFILSRSMHSHPFRDGCFFSSLKIIQIRNIPSSFITQQSVSIHSWRMVIMEFGPRILPLSIRQGRPWQYSYLYCRLKTSLFLKQNTNSLFFEVRSAISIFQIFLEHISTTFQALSVLSKVWFAQFQTPALK